MKANRKFVEGEEAVSAVIGVILMVAITVAIAAAVYVYVSGMISGTTQSTPNVTFIKDESENTLKVSSADPGISWSDINITVTDGTNTEYIEKSGTVTAGDTIDFDDETTTCSGDITITIRYEPTNSLMGTYTLSDVS